MTSKILKSILLLIVVLMILSATVSASPGNYFNGWSETDVETYFSRNIYKKRSVATTDGYEGYHYLRARVEYPWFGGDVGGTDTGREYDTEGFKIKSGWGTCSYSPATVGVAKAYWGTE